MTKRIVLYMLFSLSLLQHTLAQHDQRFSQIMFNQAFINPGYAGSDTSRLFNAILLNRDQMSGLDEAPVSRVLNVNGPLDIKGVKGGVSLSLFSDELGKITSPGFNLGYAYKIPVSKGSLGVGISAGMLFTSLKGGNWILPEGGDDEFIPGAEGNKKGFDFNVGAYYSLNNWNIGISALHLTQPSFIAGDKGSKIKPMFTLNAGYSFILNPLMRLNANVYLFSDETVRGTISSVLFYKEKFWGGLNFTPKDAVGVIIGLNLVSELRVGYCYEYNTSKISKFGGGTHEFMAAFRFSLLFEKGNQKYKSVRYL